MGFSVLIHVPPQPRIVDHEEDDDAPDAPEDSRRCSREPADLFTLAGGSTHAGAAE
jgi:hypothetical protein